jgi:hypothetical protein
MSPSVTHPSTAQDARARTDQPRRARSPKALVVLVLAAIAAFPFPWWW